jgi:glycosyl transferase family 2
VLIVVADREGDNECFDFNGIKARSVNGRDGVIAAYEFAWRHWDRADLIGYVHNDVTIYDELWKARIEAEFDDPIVGICGFGGAKRHGSPLLYKTRYELTQLARFDYYSNTDDAEVHGTRFAGSMDVAVLDGFALFVRRELLDKCNGWEPDKWPPHHIYDYRICAEARRHGYRVRMVGVRCQHHGGKTSVSDEYQQWAKQTKWGSDVEMHKEGHRLFYERYRDVMPYAAPHANPR